MNLIFLTNKSDRNQLLRYSHESGPIDECPRISCQYKPTPRGVYAKFDGMFVGAIGSKLGPFLFIGTQEYYFSDKSWSVKTFKEENRNVFSLINKGVVSLSIEYKPLDLDELDPWSDDESEDFFIWLEAKRNDEEFIEMWTLNV